MRKKLGRNDPCWRGSGKKFKKCHMNRDRMPRPQIYEVAPKLKKIYNKGYCLHPDANNLTCAGNIIRAHTIQRNGGLSRISLNGHVYGFKLDLTSISKNRDKLAPELIGINLASTFTGFCGFHDNKTFEPIERFPFSSNPEHTFLLAYRAICREFFTKQPQLEATSFAKNLDTGRSQKEQILMQKYFNAHESGALAGFQDISHHKKIFDKVLMKGDYSCVKYYVLRLNAIPEFMCSGAISPECDFEGNLLQNFADFSKRLDLITFTTIATDTGGAVVFVWLNDTFNACHRFIKTLDNLPLNEIPHAITRFAVEFFENIYFSPVWWDGLSDDTKKKIMDRKKLALSPTTKRDKACLLDDGLRAVTWKVVTKETNA